MSKIQWTDETWNPVTGCTKIATGCKHCYADTEHGKRHKAYLAHGGVYPKTGKPMPPQYAKPFESVQLHPDRLDAPLRRRIPTKFFVCSGADLFHGDVPFEFIAAVFGVMAACPQHTFQVLTKRPARMREFLEWRWRPANVPPTGRSADGHPTRIIGGVRGWENASPSRQWADSVCWAYEFGDDDLRDKLTDAVPITVADVLPNVWLGVSVATQEDADANIPLLLQTPAAVRFVSLEPQVEPVDLANHYCHTTWQQAVDEAVARGRLEPEEVTFERDTGFHSSTHEECLPGLDWVIQGGESGKGARPFDIAWARDVRDQCRNAGVPYFLKQLGARVFTTDPDDFKAAEQRPHCTALMVERGTRIFGGAFVYRCEGGESSADGTPAYPWATSDPKGGDPSEWPMDVQGCREFPEVTA